VFKFQLQRTAQSQTIKQTKPKPKPKPNVTEIELVLLCEMSLVVDCGQCVYDFVYKYEGDGLVSPYMHRAKELMLTKIAAIVEGNNSCPILLATVTERVPLGHRNEVLAMTCAKAVPVLQKAEEMFTGKLYDTFEMYHGLSLLVPFNLRAADIGPPTHTLIDKILAIPALATSHGLRDALIGELPQFYILAEGVAADVDLLTWWFNVRKELPTWYNKVLPFAVIMQPTSCTAERMFSMMKWMFNDNQHAALEDYKETALLMRYNQLQRLRNAPALLVELDN